MTKPVRIGIVTVSDRASAGVYEDRGGPAIHDYFKTHLSNIWQPLTRIIADEIDLVTVNRFQSARYAVDGHGYAAQFEGQTR